MRQLHFSRRQHRTSINHLSILSFQPQTAKSLNLLSSLTHVNGDKRGRIYTIAIFSILKYPQGDKIAAQRFYGRFYGLIVEIISA